LEHPPRKPVKAKPAAVTVAPLIKSLLVKLIPKMPPY